MHRPVDPVGRPQSHRAAADGTAQGERAGRCARGDRRHHSRRRHSRSSRTSASRASSFPGHRCRTSSTSSTATSGRGSEPAGRAASEVCHLTSPITETVPYTLLLADDSVTIQRVIELTFADEDVHGRRRQRRRPGHRAARGVAARHRARRHRHARPERLRGRAVHPQIAEAGAYSGRAADRRVRARRSGARRRRRLRRRAGEAVRAAAGDQPGEGAARPRKRPDQTTSHPVDADAEQKRRPPRSAPRSPRRSISAGRPRSRSRKTQVPRRWRRPNRRPATPRCDRSHRLFRSAGRRLFASEACRRGAGRAAGGPPRARAFTAGRE